MATRREFLRGAAMGTMSALLASCGGAALSGAPMVQGAAPQSWDELHAIETVLSEIRVLA
jgi:hypothetical protein